MATIERTGDELVVHMSRWERIASLHVDVWVPLSAVRGAKVVPDGLKAIRGVRAPGTGLPGRLLYGTTRHSTGKDFCIVRGHGPAIEVSLEGEVFSRLLVSDAAATVTLAGLGLEDSGGHPSTSAE
jgi:hypothetical protein